MLDKTDRHLLNLIQTAFPLEVRPFDALARELGVSEQEVIERVSRLKEKRIIRQISAIFDSRALGYRSSLVAFKVDPGRIGVVARKVNAHPGVSHNYRRDHDYNLWFTITVPPESDIEREVEALAGEPGVMEARLFPTIRLFKIGVTFDMSGEEYPSQSEPNRGKNAHSCPAANREQVPGVREDDIPAIRALQEDLPVEPRPFAGLARKVNMTDEMLVAKAHDFLDRGLMRRYAAILRHREAGFAANAMGAWNVPENQILEFGKKAASFQAVSHCYERPTYPDWPYSVFTMIHGRTREDCEMTARRISEATGVSDYVLLYSIQEYKKNRVRYFE